MLAAKDLLGLLEKADRQKEQASSFKKFHKHGKKLKMIAFPRRGDDT